MEFSEEGMTSYAGLELLTRYLRRIGFNGHVRQSQQWLPHRYFAHSGDQLAWRMEAVTHHQTTAALVALPLVPFGVFSHFRLQGHLQHLSSPFPEESLQVRPQLVPGYALHLNCRIFSHERILSPSLPREL